MAPVREDAGGDVLKYAAKLARRAGPTAYLWPDQMAGGGESYDFGDGLSLFLHSNWAANQATRQSTDGEPTALAELWGGDDASGGAVYIKGAERLGPVARASEGLFGEKRLTLLRPDLFDGAVAPREAELRAKRALLAPLILAGSLGGRLPGYGEGVNPKEFDFQEGFDPPVLDIGPIVTPLPEARGPQLLITPDESDRIAQQYLDWAQKGGFQPSPEWLRRPLVVEIRAPHGGLNGSNAWGLLDQVRGKMNTHDLVQGGARRAGPRNFPPLGDYIPVTGDGLGTVAVVQVGEHIFVGASSGKLNDRYENLTPGRLVSEQFDLPNVADDPSFHAESDALIRAYFRTPGALPRELTLYVDRDTCRGCKKILPDVLEAISVDRLNIVMKSGEQIPPLVRRGLMKE